MKIIFNRKIYDTEMSNAITFVRHSSQNNISWYHEVLYRSQNGAWFTAGEGGPLSHYGIDLGDGNKEGSSKLTPMSCNQVVEWLERHAKYSVIEEYFYDQLEIA
ncbi:conserved hypothetical protein [Roseovarius sp. EC-HK134]|uniref:hypothetical protein n=1 Tax=unclassified Roseovarius TaxID=2614913 RepID=UPI0012569787|nr:MULTISPECIES: hypothetical protein [unclassified Roseovarius]VVT33167.1 conserved hypothetical protein [Roseovarius sp. EC-SD190]VVT33209.1 conserved hypothetical protein [Roseovarius sp. EC-HK134]